MARIGEGEWLGADGQHLEWAVRLLGDGDFGADGVTMAQCRMRRDLAQDDADRMLGNSDNYSRDLERTGVVWRRVGPWHTGEPPADVPLPEATPTWTDPASGAVYDLSRPLIDMDGDYWHHVGQLDLDDGPMPLMAWSATGARADVGRRLDELRLLRDVIAEHGPLATVNGTA